MDNNNKNTLYRYCLNTILLKFILKCTELHNLSVRACHYRYRHGHHNKGDRGIYPPSREGGGNMPIIPLRFASYYE